MSEDATATMEAEPTTAEPIEAVDQATPSEPVVSDNADDDAADDAWLAARNAPAKTEAPASKAPEAPAQPTQDTQPTKADTAPALTDEHRTLLKRFQLDESDVAVLKPERRAAFLKNLEDRATYTDGLQQKLAGYEKPAATPPQQSQPQAPAQPAPDVDKLWKPIADVFGDENAAGSIRQAVEATVDSLLQSRLAHLAQSRQDGPDPLVSQILDRLWQDDVAAAYESLELPEGVNKDDAKVREQIEAKARELMSTPGKAHLAKYNARHAIKEASVLLFHDKIAEATRKQQARARQESLKRTPEPLADRPTQRRVPKDDDEFDDLVLAGLKKGLTPDAAERFAANGGVGE